MRKSPAPTTAAILASTTWIETRAVTRYCRRDRSTLVLHLLSHACVSPEPCSLCDRVGAAAFANSFQILLIDDAAVAAELGRGGPGSRVRRDCWISRASNFRQRRRRERPFRHDERHDAGGGRQPRAAAPAADGRRELPSAAEPVWRADEHVRGAGVGVLVRAQVPGPRGVGTVRAGELHGARVP